MPNGIKPLCLMIFLLLSACHSAPVSQPPQDATATAPIDATKSLFPLGNYSQSVDKWIPPGPQRRVPVMDAATQQRHFFALKSHYFGMGPNDESPWNPHYIAAVLKREAESHRDAAMDKHLGSGSVSWGKTSGLTPTAGNSKSEITLLRTLARFIILRPEALRSGRRWSGSCRRTIRLMTTLAWLDKVIPLIICRIRLSAPALRYTLLRKAAINAGNTSCRLR